MKLSAVCHSVAVAVVAGTVQRNGSVAAPAAVAAPTAFTAARAPDDGGGKSAAVDKVITMLEDLQAQVLEEGEKEAKSYDKFACFCKDTTTDKTDMIEKGSDESQSLTAKINDLSAERADLDDKIQGLEVDIAETEKTIKEANQERKHEKAEYDRNEADLAGAIMALDGAMKAMQKGKDASLIQLKGDAAEALRQAMLMADVLGFGGAKAQKVGAAFLQQVSGEPPAEDYSHHSGDIISTLEGLQGDFRKQKEQVDKDEETAVAAHEKLIKEQEEILKTKNEELDDSKAAKIKKQGLIAENTEQLTTVAATLLDDKSYLMQLTDMCSLRAKTWDQRTGVRRDELSALTAAITIIKGTVAEKTSSGTVRFAQTGVSVHLAEVVARNPDAMESLEEEAEEDPVPSFIQLRGSRLAKKGEKKFDPREVIMALLRSKGTQLHSTMLTALAGRIATDPFAKIKNLIQEVIERLLKEAGSEANQKGYCDKALGDARQKRDNAASEVEELNGEMAEFEATRDKLAEELDTLAEEIDTLKKKRTEAEDQRGEEKAENEATIEEAKLGLEAVDEAIDILNKFYKAAGNEKAVTLVQKGPMDDAPDAGFEGGEAYKGAGAESGGIVGMLEVIKSDFERTISETTKEEAAADKDHLGFMTETGKSLAEKTMAEEQKDSQKDNAEEKLASATDNMKTQTGILVTAIEELKTLQPECIDTGMSYEERVARREDEIESLKTALCIFENFEEYGEGGSSDAC